MPSPRNQRDDRLAETKTVETTDSEIRQLVDALDAERQPWIEGRFDPDAGGTMIQAVDMTIFGPFGGEAGTGGADLRG